MLRLVRSPAAKPEESDADLVQRALAGDHSAEAVLYERHARAVFRLVQRLYGSTDEVEDIVHDVFVHALDKLEKLREPAAFRGWLKQIAVAEVRQTIRKKRLRRRLGLLPSKEEPVLEQLSQGLPTAEVRADLAVVDRVLSTLHVDERLVWLLRHVQQEKLHDIAEITGCSVATVKRRVDRAQQRIERALGRSR